ncbi:MAG: DNA photolyase [Methylococcaceae bacterium]|nr:DNA photolyase [Methylococcaceae bacterium]
MIETIYIEKNIVEHERARSICDRFPSARKIICDRYSEVFNPKAQNFRLQKRQPSLILAEKFKHFVLPAPPGYGIGGSPDFYFSHMLNCLYDCRYCFLQGMYRSAHYVIFVNFEDFQDEIRKIAAQNGSARPHFFSGYDCDSLAMEPVTGFADSFLDLFEKLPGACLELRTKSTQIRSLLAREALPNCIVAFSFTPLPVSKALEHKVPSIERRIDALSRLSRNGWPIGLRFDPMIYETNYRSNYRRLFERIFTAIDGRALHSVSIGSFRLPNAFFRTMKHLYPEEKLFASPLERNGSMISYRSSLEHEMMQYCTEALLRHVPQHKLFPCSS